MRRCVAAADGRDRGRWLEERQKYLTASDVGAVMRTNKWKRPIDVYREKVCGAEEIDNEHIRRGNRLEPVILDAWASGGGVFRGPGTPYRACATLYRSVQYPWLAATPDAFARVEGATVVVDVKAPAKRPGPDYPYPHYVDQVLTQMLVCGVFRGFLVAGVESGSSSLIIESFEVRWDPSRAEEIVDTSRRFVDCVQKRSLAFEFF